MTLSELSVQYRTHAAAMKGRIEELEGRCAMARNKEERRALERRIRLLTSMYRDAKEMAALTGHYYDRGYHSNGKYKM